MTPPSYSRPHVPLPHPYHPSRRLSSTHDPLYTLPSSALLCILIRLLFSSSFTPFTHLSLHFHHGFSAHIHTTHIPSPSCPPCPPDSSYRLCSTYLSICAFCRRRPSVLHLILDLLLHVWGEGERDGRGRPESCGGRRRVLRCRSSLGGDCRSTSGEKLLSYVNCRRCINCSTEADTSVTNERGFRRLETDFTATIKGVTKQAHNKASTSLNVITTTTTLHSRPAHPNESSSPIPLSLLWPLHRRRRTRAG
jgi:hypothetical protein